jgi:hypothetical protein
MLTHVARIMVLKPDEQVELMFELAARTNTPIPPAVKDSLAQALAEYQSLAARRIRYRKQEERLRELQKVFALGFNEVQQQVLSMLASSGAEPIISAINSKLVDLHPLEVEGDLEAILSEFLEQAHKIVQDGKSYPLFDEQTGQLLGSSIQEGKLTLSEVQMARGRSAPFVATLLERLPLFESATFSELLDIRRELSKSLVRFRGAMLRFSDSIKAAPWDKDFAPEVQTLIDREVEPAIVEIEDAVRSNSYLTQVLLRVADKPLTLAGGSALAIAVSQAEALSALAAQGLGLTAAAAINVASAHREWKERQREVHSNELYFYYRARKRLT